MRILWTVNLVPVTISKKIGSESSVLGGWVEAMIGQFVSNGEHELAVACKTELGTSFCETISGIKYYSLNYSQAKKEERLKERCEFIVEDFNPDIIHIEGTEFLHAKVMLETANRKGLKSVVSAQGILNGQYNYQCGQLQIDDMIFSRSITNMIAGLTLHLRKTRWYKPRMETECETLKQASNFLGRTTWDKAHLYSINPTAKYYHCSRVLRKPFYEKKWSIETMERHSIYVGNGYFALKGLHFLLMALPQLINEYPDLKLYVAGYEPVPKNDKRPFYKKGYAGYLKKLITDLKIGDHVIFTGPLTAEQVADRLVKSNVYVLSSTVENSPNTLGEAMLVGTPSIAAYVGGVPDMAEDGKEVLFFRNDDPSLIAWNIKRIFDNDELAENLSANSKTKAKLTHNADKNFNDLIDTYNQIICEE